eukprot:2864246-Amphidinium_carterae.1
MDVSTPRGTGGLSPPPAPAGTRLDRPPGAALLAQASLPAGVRTADVHRTVESTVASGAGGEAPDFARGRQPGPRPARTSVFSMLGASVKGALSLTSAKLGLTPPGQAGGG